ncbi:MAG: GIY-YIG nuclease family protein [Planctomycetaceae bacterium]
MTELSIQDVVGNFAGFGPSAVLPPTNLHGCLAIAGSKQERRRTIRAECPAEPGVYGMVDNVGQLIYVGFSRQLRNRLLTYFSGGKGGRKERRIGRHTVSLRWEVAGHEFPALLREMELIQRFQPTYNVRGLTRGREPAYLYLTGGDAPRFRLSTRVPVDARWRCGPLPGNRWFREAVDRLNIVMRLRDCPNQVRMYFSDQPQLFEAAPTPQCLRAQIGTCLAPCAVGCSRRTYQAQVRKAVALLDGRDSSPLDRLAAEMQTAATRREFEKAARLRDDHEAVSKICEALAQLRTPYRPQHGVYPVQRGDGTLWYLIGNGLLAGMLLAPTSRTEALSAIEQLEKLSHVSEEPAWSIGRSSVRLVRSWFRQRPDEEVAILPVETALAHCQSLCGRRRRRTG